MFLRGFQSQKQTSQWVEISARKMTTIASKKLIPHFNAIIQNVPQQAQQDVLQA